MLSSAYNNPGSSLTDPANHVSGEDDSLTTSRESTLQGSRSEGDASDGSTLSKVPPVEVPFNYLPPDAIKKAHVGKVLKITDDRSVDSALSKMEQEKKHLKEWVRRHIQVEMLLAARKTQMKTCQGTPVENFSQIGEAFIACPHNDENQKALYFTLFGVFDQDTSWMKILEDKALIEMNWKYIETTDSLKPQESTFIQKIIWRVKRECARSIQNKSKNKCKHYIKNSQVNDLGAASGKKMDGKRREIGKFYPDYFVSIEEDASSDAEGKSKTILKYGPVRIKHKEGTTVPLRDGKLGENLQGDGKYSAGSDGKHHSVCINLFSFFLLYITFPQVRIHTRMIWKSPKKLCSSR